MPFELPQLNYAYDALEPHIDSKTMEIHHTKHHQAYTDKLNAALDGQSDLQSKQAEDIIANISDVPEDIRQAVRNHGGGYINHNLFWQVMHPDGGGEPSDELAQAIDNHFSSYSAFKDEFTKAATTQFGSGWAWLVVDGDDRLLVMKTANQDSPLSEGNTPILALDIWEHAYYLNYQNRRADYIDAWWNIVNWGEVGKKYQAALEK